MPSTVIRRFCYAPHSQELTVELVTGRRYLYTGVPAGSRGISSDLCQGVYFNRYIRGRYPFRGLTEAD